MNGAAPLAVAPDAAPRRGAGALPALATAAAAWPLLLLTLLYGQWLVSWCVLGHMPQPSRDDPKDIAGANWLHGPTGLVLLVFVPMLPVAALLNAAVALRHRNQALALVVRTTAVAALWCGTLLLLRADPGQVVSWWLD